MAQMEYKTHILMFSIFVVDGATEYKTHILMFSIFVRRWRDWNTKHTY